jgi:hypothetical protein
MTIEDIFDLFEPRLDGKKQIKVSENTKLKNFKNDLIDNNKVKTNLIKNPNDLNEAFINQPDNEINEIKTNTCNE